MNLYQEERCRDGCGLSVWVPVVSECSTCNGTGNKIERDHNCGDSSWKNEEHKDCGPCPNPDCVSGKVTQQGTIRRHCSVHDSWPTLAESDLVCLQGDDDYLAGVRSGACVFGLVLVVPLEETT